MSCRCKRLLFKQAELADIQSAWISTGCKIVQIRVLLSFILSFKLESCNCVETVATFHWHCQTLSAIGLVWPWYYDGQKSDLTDFCRLPASSRDQHRRCTSMSSWYFTRDLLSFFPPWHPLIALVPLASFDETIHGNSTSCLTCFYSLQIILQVHCEAINCAAWLPLPKLLRVPAARHVPCTVYILAVFERDFPLRFCKVEADAWFLCFN